MARLLVGLLCSIVGAIRVSIERQSLVSVACSQGNGKIQYGVRQCWNMGSTTSASLPLYRWRGRVEWMSNWNHTPPPPCVRARQDSICFYFHLLGSLHKISWPVAALGNRDSSRKGYNYPREIMVVVEGTLRERGPRGRRSRAVILVVAPQVSLRDTVSEE